MADRCVLAGMPTVLGLTPLRSQLDALEDNIPHTMPQFQAAVFKLGQWAVVGFDGVATLIHSGCVLQQRLCAQYFQYLNRIGLPIGGAVNISTWLLARSQLGNQRRLDQSTFVVPRLVPWVWKKDVHAIKG